MGEKGGLKECWINSGKRVQVMMVKDEVVGTKRSDGASV